MSVNASRLARCRREVPVGSTWYGSGRLRPPNICGHRLGFRFYRTRSVDRAESYGLKITQKSAWFLLQRIRLAMQTGTFEKLGGQVEVDETFIGGKARFMHPHKRAEKIKGTGGSGKVAVMGLLQRHGHGGKKHSTVRTQVVATRKRHELDAAVRQHVETGAEIFTDELPSYNQLAPDYVHNVINHAETYVKGNVHTNGMENFWSLLKRCCRRRERA